MHVRAPDQDDATVLWADRAESASVVCGTVAAVLAMGLAVAVPWYWFWGLPLLDDPGIVLTGAIDVVLVLLAITFHRLSVDLGGR